MTPELLKVQKTLLTLHRETFSESCSPMKLQKLCYYAQGLALADGALGESLFEEDFQAWMHGPVIPDLYHEYKVFGWRQISTEFSEHELLDATSRIYKHLKEVVEAFGRFDGGALSTMTHREAPWSDARADLAPTDGGTKVIEKSALKRYFTEVLKVD
jgi:uncharacterized phage-associated protein